MSGFKSTEVLTKLSQSHAALSAAERDARMKKVNAIFQFDIKNAAGEVNTWVIDFKNEGTITQGLSSAKPDIVMNCADDVFVDLASGKLNGQKAFMQGKLKVRGNMMLATRLDGVLKPAPKPEKATSAPSNASSGGISVPGFASSEAFNKIAAGIASLPGNQRESIVQKTKAVFQFDIKNGEGKIQSFTLDLKNGSGDVYVGAAKAKADVILSMADNDFVDLSLGKLNGQKAFMSGKLKVRGQIMLATKLDGVLKATQKKAKL